MPLPVHSPKNFTRSEPIGTMGNNHHHHDHAASDVPTALIQMKLQNAMKWTKWTSEGILILFLLFLNPSDDQPARSSSLGRTVSVETMSAPCRLTQAQFAASTHLWIPHRRHVYADHQCPKTSFVMCLISVGASPTVLPLHRFPAPRRAASLGHESNPLDSSLAKRVPMRQSGRCPFPRAVHRSS